MNDDSTSEDWDNYVKENEKKIFCPNDKPFWTGEECIQCPALFNIITKKCMECEEGFALHTDTHKCEPAEPLEPSLVDLFNAIFWSQFILGFYVLLFSNLFDIKK